MERYSERKRTTKPEPLYSTLKPETSSDSPSAKSKGERLDSANRITNRISNKWNIKNKPQNVCMPKRLREENIQKERKVRERQTS